MGAVFAAQTSIPHAVSGDVNRSAQSAQKGLPFSAMRFQCVM
jgi:hypothetical protein